MIEALHIIQINDRLREETDCELVWHPEHSNQRYRCNIEFTGDVEIIVSTIKKHCADQNVIDLTVHNDFIFYN